MLGRTHAIAAGLIFAPLIYVFSTQGYISAQASILFMLGALMGVMLPDVDVKSVAPTGGLYGKKPRFSIVGIFAFLLNGITKILLFYPVVLLLFLAGEKKPLQHRGVFHSLVGVLLLTLFWSAIFYILDLGGFVSIAASIFLSQGLFLGAISHLYTDMLTRSGIEPFYPRAGRLAGAITTGTRGVSAILDFFHSEEFAELLLLGHAAGITYLIVYTHIHPLLAVVASVVGLILIAVLCGVHHKQPYEGDFGHQGYYIEKQWQKTAAQMGKRYDR